ncbi:Calcium-transporting ATPase 1 [Neomoorella glycerini]|uniref:Calcium-transporting ATPase 1 n=1 Tax=Neomoorella glycerini TaxID=55779 RepID=A0A6I5ZXK9_9FIRM|nr:cation-transporting P-type ATPase [Moorella glycerini]QGP94011.1 Calcium-transporting ATPase 1 [Moorella glycerini]
MPAPCPWSQAPGDVLAWQQVDPEQGLSTAEAQKRLKIYGPNRTLARPVLSFWHIFAKEIREPMILLLLAVAAAYFLLGELGEALAVTAIILGIVFIEVGTEFRAKKAIAALQDLNAPTTPVLRQGKVEAINTEDVVPGDILVLQPGNRVPADARLLVSAGLAVDESPLTGESLPVEKHTRPLDPATPLPDRHNMVYQGTVISRGEGLACAVATGLETELGRIVGLTRRAREPRTPLQQFMRELSRVLALVALAFAVLIPFLQFLVAREPWPRAVLTGLSLAFATIPEELPILVTMVLGLGSLKLAREKALVRRLRAAETLGHITTVVTDKTGTLTANRLTLEALWLPGEGELLSPALARQDNAAGELLLAALLTQSPVTALEACDPLEKALAEGGGHLDLPREELLAFYPLNQDQRWVGALRANQAGATLYVKGAAEEVLAMCTGPSTREATAATLAQFAGEGKRVLAVARRFFSSQDLPAGAAAAGQDLTFLGFLIFADSLRPEAAAAVAAVQRAGIKVYLATGDHPEAARSIARQVGIPARKLLSGAELEQLNPEDWDPFLQETRVLARITPEQKLQLVQALQAKGEIVAMIGDGINDAPALAVAHVGLAMGRQGTDVAREAAGVVLSDDCFSTLATAIRQGRGLLANLQKSVRYYLAVKIALIVTMLVPAALGQPAPFSPLMIILLELFMDLAASTAFVIEPPEEPLMERPPRRPGRPFLDRPMVQVIFAGGLLLALAVGLAYQGLELWWGPAPVPIRQTAAFATWMLGHVLLAYSLRTQSLPPYRQGFFANGVLNLWALGAAAVTLMAVYLTPLQAVLGTGTLPTGAWGLVAGAALLPGLVMLLYRPGH